MCTTGPPRRRLRLAGRPRPRGPGSGPSSGDGPRGTPVEPEPVMSVSQSVATILRDHVTLEVESFDRLYLNVYVPRLQRAEGLVGYLRDLHGAQVPSTALVAPMSAAFNDRVRAFARREGVPL